MSCTRGGLLFGPIRTLVSEVPVKSSSGEQYFNHDMNVIHNFL